MVQLPRTGHFVTLTDYILGSVKVDQKSFDVARSNKIFCAAAYSYDYNQVPIGAAAYFFYPEINLILSEITSSQCLDMLVLVMLPRFIDPWYDLDLDKAMHHRRVEAENEFPFLFQRNSMQDLSGYHDAIMEQTRNFAVMDWRRTAYYHSLSRAIQQSYIEEMLPLLMKKIAPMMRNEKFFAGLDAWSQGLISYTEFAQEIFSDPEYILFPELSVENPEAFGVERSVRALALIEKSYDRNEFRRPLNIESRYPDLYRYI
jgi:hypothetical protein